MTSADVIFLKLSLRHRHRVKSSEFFASNGTTKFWATVLFSAVNGQINLGCLHLAVNLNDAHERKYLAIFQRYCWNSSLSDSSEDTQGINFSAFCIFFFLVPEYVVDWAAWWTVQLYNFQLRPPECWRPVWPYWDNSWEGLPLPSLRRAGKPLHALNWSIYTMTEV